MKQFIVPQFIDVENKILGPLSVRQFLEILATGGIIFIAYELFSFWIFAIVSVFAIAIGGTFAFVKINAQPFHLFAIVMVQTLRRPNLKVWQPGQYEKPVKIKDKKKVEPVIATKEEVDQSRLTELSLMVDTGGIYEAEKEEKPGENMSPGQSGPLPIKPVVIKRKK
ncbi:PrgI family protein [Patescibacteria group bacterium]|nr:PrgI family protein [Patescibacteria group bacterium]MBU1673167.1 PrgI family protein [Patescibacteria group bacterium]MBU1964148.1 PrgI family protein [Patescibacteria group bacterium]